jgi:hypothetical protein
LKEVKFLKRPKREFSDRRKPFLYNEMGDSDHNPPLIEASRWWIMGIIPSGYRFSPARSIFGLNPKGRTPRFSRGAEPRGLAVDEHLSQAGLLTVNLWEYRAGATPGEFYA